MTMESVPSLSMDSSFMGITMTIPIYSYNWKNTSIGKPNSISNGPSNHILPKSKCPRNGNHPPTSTPFSVIGKRFSRLTASPKKYWKSLMQTYIISTLSIMNSFFSTINIGSPVMTPNPSYPLSSPLLSFIKSKIRFSVMAH